MSAATDKRPNFAQAYEQVLVAPLFEPWARGLLDRLAPEPGEHLLDLACGTGIVARLARDRVGPAGRVVGVDISPPMLEVARQIAPDIAWREGRADAPPLEPHETFDSVTCHQGLQFFADRPAALAAMRRSLRPDGRLALAVWCPPEGGHLFHALQRIAERHIGAVDDRRHSFGDPSAIEALLADAGFDDIRIETPRMTVHFPDGAGFARLNAVALMGMSAAAAAMDEPVRAATLSAILADSAEALAVYGDGAGVAFDTAAVVATARCQPKSL